MEWFPLNRVESKWDIPNQHGPIELLGGIRCLKMFYLTELSWLCFQEELYFLYPNELLLTLLDQPFLREIRGPILERLLPNLHGPTKLLGGKISIVPPERLRLIYLLRGSIFLVPKFRWT